MRASGGLLLLAGALFAGEVRIALDGAGVPVLLAGREASTDGWGVARFADVPDGEHAVGVRLPDAGPGKLGGEQPLGSLRVEGTLVSARFALPKGREIAGHVTDGATGLPRADAAVVLKLPSGEVVAQGSSDAGGAFRFAGLLPIAFRVETDGASAFASPGSPWPLELSPLAEGARRAPVYRVVAIRGGRPVEE
ncbi:MAG: hypothetical protein ACREID_03890, partial [Planctomycetota bacterium]